MPHLDGTGPEGKGQKTGRQLGRCVEMSLEEKLIRLGKGMGLRRRVGGESYGKGKRLRIVGELLTLIKTQNKSINAMKRVIAIPLEGGRLSPHFGHCEEFALVVAENEKILEFKKVAPPMHEAGAYPRVLISQGTTDVIAFSIGERAISIFENSGVKVHRGVTIDDPMTLVEHLLASKLQTDDHCCKHDEGHHHHGHE